jgi:hypothetical protein
MTVVTASSVAPAPRFAPAAVVQSKAPPPSDELAREAPARRHNGSGLVGNGSTIYRGSYTEWRLGWQ